MHVKRSDLEKLKFGTELYEIYHNHKEQMAYAIFGLEGAFFIGLFMLGNWPPGVRAISKEILSAVFAITWIMFHAALRFQLRNRRIAAILVSAFYDSYMYGFKKKDGENYDFPAPPGKFCSLIDRILMPCRGATYHPPYDLSQLEDNSSQKQEINLLNSHLAHHLWQARSSWGAYAYPMEWITTIGSVFLLGVALLRVWSTM